MCAPNKSEETNTNLVWIHGAHGSQMSLSVSWLRTEVDLGESAMTTRAEFQNKFSNVMWQGRIVFPVKMVWRHLYTTGKNCIDASTCILLSRSAPTGTSMHLTLNRCIMCVDSKPSKKAVLLILTPQVRFNELWSTGSANYRERYENRQPLESQ